MAKVKDPNDIVGPIVGRKLTHARMMSDAIAFGPKCAAWLARDRTHNLRAAGGFNVIMPRNVEMPYWFRLCLEVFKRRWTWSVKAISNPKHVVYEFRWLLSRFYAGPVVGNA